MKTCLMLSLAACASIAGAAEWLNYNAPQGFTLQYPPGWRVRPTFSGRVEVAGPGAELAFIWPVLAPARLDSRTALLALKKLSGSAGLQANWRDVPVRAPRAVRIQGESAGRQIVAVLAWMTHAKGSPATFYAATSPQAAYSRSQETFARIFESFRLTGKAPPAPMERPAAPVAEPAYVRWQEPRENAFSIEVPSGWQSNGAIARLGLNDTRSIWTTSSPDGVRIAGGDTSVPGFTEPNDMMAASGFREGTWMNAYGERRFVRRWIPGAVFAREYAAGLALACSDLQLNESREKPEVVASLNRVAAEFRAYGIAQNVSAGESTFSCRCQGQQTAGYVFAGVQRTQSAGGSRWNVIYLYSYMAPAAQAPTAHRVLQHIIRSFTVDPQWHARELRASAQAAEIIRRANQAVSDGIMDAYWNRQRVTDDLDTRRSNAIRGVEDVIDPQFGQRFQIETGSEYYWIDHRGNIVGTQTQYQPGLEFREMLRLP